MDGALGCHASASPAEFWSTIEASTEIFQKYDAASMERLCEHGASLSWDGQHITLQVPQSNRMWQDFLEDFRQPQRHAYVYLSPKSRKWRIEVSAAIAVLLKQGIALDVPTHMELFQVAASVGHVSCLVLGLDRINLLPNRDEWQATFVRKCKRAVLMGCHFERSSLRQGRSFAECVRLLAALEPFSADEFAECLSPRSAFSAVQWVEAAGVEAGALFSGLIRVPNIGAASRLAAQHTDKVLAGVDDQDRQFVEDLAEREALRNRGTSTKLEAILRCTSTGIEMDGFEEHCNGRIRIRRKSPGESVPWPLNDPKELECFGTPAERFNEGSYDQYSLPDCASGLMVQAVHNLRKPMFVFLLLMRGKVISTRRNRCPLAYFTHDDENYTLLQCVVCADLHSAHRTLVAGHARKRLFLQKVLAEQGAASCRYLVDKVVDDKPWCARAFIHCCEVFLVAKGRWSRSCIRSSSALPAELREVLRQMQPAQEQPKHASRVLDALGHGSLVFKTVKEGGQGGVGVPGTWLEENGHGDLVGLPFEAVTKEIVHLRYRRWCRCYAAKLMRMLIRCTQETFKSMEAQLQCLLQHSSSTRRLLMKRCAIVTDQLTPNLRLPYGTLGPSTPFWPLLSDADKEVLLATKLQYGCQCFEWSVSFKLSAFAWLERGEGDQTHQTQSHIARGWFRIPALRSWPPPGFVFCKAGSVADTASGPEQEFEERTLLRVLEEDGDRLLVQQMFHGRQTDPFLRTDPASSATWIQRELTLQICPGDEVEARFDFDPSDPRDFRLPPPGQDDKLSLSLGVQAIRRKLEKDHYNLSAPYCMPAWTVLPRLHCAVLGGSIPLMQHFLHQGDPVDEICSIGLSPLHLAVASMDKRSTELLLKAKADFTVPAAWKGASYDLMPWMHYWSLQNSRPHPSRHCGRDDAEQAALSKELLARFQLRHAAPSLPTSSFLSLGSAAAPQALFSLSKSIAASLRFEAAKCSAFMEDLIIRQRSLRALKASSNALHASLDRDQLAVKLEEASSTLERERSVRKTEAGKLQAALRNVEQQNQELLQVVQTRAESLSKSSHAEDPCDMQLSTQDSHREAVAPQGDDVVNIIRSQMLESHGPFREMAIGSLDHFAYNLVNHSAHCILELIQNADDAEYADGVRASQHFIAGEPSEQWPHGYLVAACNERGFSGSDVRALCNINQSQKAVAKNKTGRKGIGFKSCFCISDRVHVFSGEFSFVLDVAKYGTLGMVTPEKVSAPALLADLLKDFNTVLFLPLKQTSSETPFLDQVTAQLHRLFDTSEAACLLFLRRLRRVTFMVRGTEKTLELQAQRLDAEDGLSISHEKLSQVGHQCLEYAVARVQVSTQNAPLRNHQGSVAAAAYTEISVAVPLHEVDKNQELVFCTLPVRAEGFSFAINADFDLVATRSELELTAFNSFLRRAIAQLLGRALQNPSFKNLADRPGSPALTRILEHQVNDLWWLALIEDLGAQLSDVPCVLCEPCSGPCCGGQRMHHAPRDVLLRGASQELLTTEILSECCGKHFATPGQSRSLDLPKLSLEDLAQCMQHGSFVGQSGFMLQQTDSWFVSLYEFIFAEWQQDKASRLAIIREMPIFPVEGRPDLARLQHPKIFTSLPTSPGWALEFGPRLGLRMLRASLATSLWKRGGPAMQLLQSLGVTEAPLSELLHAARLVHMSHPIEADALAASLRVLRDFNLGRLKIDETGAEGATCAGNLELQLQVPTTSGTPIMLGAVSLPHVLGIACPEPLACSDYTSQEDALAWESFFLANGAKWPALDVILPKLAVAISQIVLPEEPWATTLLEALMAELQNQNLVEPLQDVEVSVLDCHFPLRRCFAVGAVTIPVLAAWLPVPEKLTAVPAVLEFLGLHVDVSSERCWVDAYEFLCLQKCCERGAFEYVLKKLSEQDLGDPGVFGFDREVLVPQLRGFRRSSVLVWKAPSAKIAQLAGQIQLCDQYDASLEEVLVRVFRIERELSFYRLEQALMQCLAGFCGFQDHLVLSQIYEAMSKTVVPQFQRASVPVIMPVGKIARQVPLADAYWDVKPSDAHLPEAHRALSRFYEPGLRSFFVETLGVQEFGSFEDFYSVLELARGASLEEVRAAYKRLALRWHPDKAVHRGVDRQEAERKFKEIGEAYEALKRKLESSGANPQPQSRRSENEPFDPYRVFRETFFNSASASSPSTPASPHAPRARAAQPSQSSSQSSQNLSPLPLPQAQAEATRQKLREAFESAKQRPARPWWKRQQKPRTPSPEFEEAPDAFEVGAEAEFIVFQHFKELLSSFDERNWMSSNRAWWFPECLWPRPDDQLGYDFEWIDRDNFYGNGYGCRVRFEVKGTGDREFTQGYLSGNEWEVAQDSDLYILVCVSNVRKNRADPVRIDFYPDLEQEVEKGRLHLRALKYRLSIGQDRSGRDQWQQDSVQVDWHESVWNEDRAGGDQWQQADGPAWSEGGSNRDRWQPEADWHESAWHQDRAGGDQWQQADGPAWSEGGSNRDRWQPEADWHESGWNQDRAGGDQWQQADGPAWSEGGSNRDRWQPKAHWHESGWNQDRAGGDQWQQADGPAWSEGGSNRDRWQPEADWHESGWNQGRAGGDQWQQADSHGSSWNEARSDRDRWQPEAGWGESVWIQDGAGDDHWQQQDGGTRHQ
ncbi:NOV [Symbiodinium sp. CCMP2592]|nr:NOV [Symbiodinium sp. CCMP2592]